jgi:hypothetical protein
VCNALEMPLAVDQRDLVARAGARLDPHQVGPRSNGRQQRRDPLGPFRVPGAGVVGQVPLVQDDSGAHAPTTRGSIAAIHSCWR